MPIELTTQFMPYVDEQFKEESKLPYLTNQDYSWIGAHSIKVYKISTSVMNDYDRAGTGKNPSRYGAIAGLDATTEEMTLKKDRSFTFAIDKLDQDETRNTLGAAAALARQNREVVIPEVDTYVYGVMTDNAGTKPAALALTADNIASEIFKGTTALDEAEFPETARSLVVTPAVYQMMKESKQIVMNTEIGNTMRMNGIISNLDGMNVIRVPASRLPKGFGFMICHVSATVAPVKLADFKIHDDPPGISGSLVEGRICYDAFVLDNKKKGIYYQQQPTA